MKSVKNGTGTFQDLASPEIQAKITRPLISVKEIKEVAETAPREELDKAVAEAQKYIAKIPEFMSRSVTRIRTIQAVSAEERMMRHAEFEGLIDSVLSHLEISESATPEEKLLNEAARQAYAMALVSTLPVADNQALARVVKGSEKSRLPGLLRVGILEPLGKGKGKVSVKVGGNLYKVSGGHQFATKIAELLSKNSVEATKIAYENHQTFRELAEEIKTQATISVADLISRKSGHFSMNIPDVKTGEKPLPGGVLLGESDGRAIRVVKAIGHFQRSVTEIAESGVFIPVESLGRDRLELAKRLSEDKFRLAWKLHAILRRGVAEAQKEAPRAIPKAERVPGTSGKVIELPAPETLPLPADDTSAMLPAVLH